VTEAYLYTTAVHRLRERARRFGAAVLVLGLLPVEVVAGHPQFLWQVLAAQPPAGAVAALAPALCGLALLLASRFVRRGLTLALTGLTTLLSTAVAVHFGGAAAAWEALSLPPSVTERPLPAVLSLAACSAGVHLAFKPAMRGASRALLGLSLLAATAYYLVPVRGEAPGVALWDMLAHLGELPHWRLQLGFGVIGVMLAWPGAIALAAQRYHRAVPTQEEPVLGLAALYGLPVMFGMLLYRALPMGGPGWPFVLAGVELAVLATLLSMLGSTLEVLLEGLLSPEVGEAELDLPPGWPARRLFGAHLGTLGALSLGLALLARPPHKGVDWSLRPSTPAADTLYGELLPAWNDARWTWDRRVRDESGAMDLVGVRKAGRALVEAAPAVDPGLGAAVDRLVTESRTLDLAGRRWYALVGAVNDAAQAAGQPYYLDPTVYEYGAEDGVRRHFRVRSYRIEAVTGLRVDAGDFAALHVRHLGDAFARDSRLGFSRDLQPFALVVLDEIEAWAKNLSAGHCGLQDTDAPALTSCERVLADLRADPDFDLVAAITRITERHELQHQIDGPELPMPTAVVRLTGRYDDAVRQRVNRELSAYVMELTTAGVPPRLSLAHMLPFALNPGSAEHLVALLVFEALTDRTLVDPRSGELDEANITAAFDTLAGVNDETLRQRADALWHRWY
jgi:hypothetical protein